MFHVHARAENQPPGLIQSEPYQFQCMIATFPDPGQQSLIMLRPHLCWTLVILWVSRHHYFFMWDTGTTLCHTNRREGQGAWVCSGASYFLQVRLSTFSVRLRSMVVARMLLSMHLVEYWLLIVHSCVLCLAAKLAGVHTPAPRSRDVTILITFQVRTFWILNRCWQFLVRWKALDLYFLKHSKLSKSVQKRKSSGLKRMLLAAPWNPGAGGVDSGQSWCKVENTVVYDSQFTSKF